MGPHHIIKVELIEGIFVPFLRVKSTIGTRTSRAVVQHPTNNLDGLINQQSTQQVDSDAPRTPKGMLLPRSLPNCTGGLVDPSEMLVDKGSLSKQKVVISSLDEVPH